MDVLVKVCTALNVDFADVIEIVSDENIEGEEI